MPSKAYSVNGISASRKKVRPCCVVLQEVSPRPGRTTAAFGLCGFYSSFPHAYPPGSRGLELVDSRKYCQAMDNRITKHGEPVDPGPGYRWATRPEKAIALVLDLGNTLVAAASGAIAGAVLFGIIAYGIPLLSSTAATTLDGSSTNQGATNTGDFANVLHNSVHGLTLVAGLIVGGVAALIVATRVLKALPWHSGPVRPVGPSPQH